MKSLYYLGEIKYQQGDFVGAHQKFEELAKEYPGTTYMDKVVQREYEIAQTWLDHNSGADPERVLPWNARFWGGLPVFDTGGHAVAALEQVRLNDPKGPLADDALMTIAEHHYKKGDYEMAAEYFDQMTEDPELAKSPLLHKALLGGIDSKIKGYIGPEYDMTGLEEAREASLRAMQLFPERQTSTEEGGPDLHKTLDLINDQEAERAYSVGSYYRRAGRVTSAEFYFGKIVHKWPQSPWAEMARDQLTELAKMPRKESKPSTIMVRPGADPYGSGSAMSGAGAGAGGMGGLGGMGSGLGVGGP
jgi:TolA-binding protein